VPSLIRVFTIEGKKVFSVQFGREERRGGMINAVHILFVL